MGDARTRGWGNPDSPGYKNKNIIKIMIEGKSLFVHRAVAPLFEGFLNEVNSKGYSIARVYDDWGYNNRDIRGRPGVKSNHSWGLAIDINSTTNPMTEDGKIHTDMPRWIRRVAHKYGLFWGADYSGKRKDPMHFEFLGTPADAKAQVAALNGTNEVVQEDEEMATYAKSLDDDARADIREWCTFYWGAGKMTVKDQTFLLNYMKANGRDLCLAQIIDHDKAKAYRASK